MTSIKTVPSHPTAVVGTPNSRQKGVLFCPSCGHESAVNGDWVVDGTDDGRTYRCPECQTVLGSR